MRVHLYLTTATVALSALAFTTAATDPICTSGIYASLAPLSTFPPARSFCSQRYPPGTTTVYKRNAFGLEKHERRTVAAAATTNPTTTTLTTSMSKSFGTSANDRLLSSLSVATATSIAKTFCSCIQPPKTVRPTTTISSSRKPTSTTPSTTATATASSSTSSAAPPPASATCGQEGRTQNRIGPNDYANPYPGGDNFAACKAYCLGQADAAGIRTVAYGTPAAPACACYNLPLAQVYQPEAGTGAFFSDINCPS